MREFADEGQALAALALRVRAEYGGLPPFERIRRLSGGERNDVFLAEGGGKRRVVRIIHPLTSIEGMRYINAWTRFAALHIPEAVAPLLTDSGDTLFVHDGMFVCVYPFAEGAYGVREREAHRLAAARLQARLHRVGLLYPALERTLSLEKTPRRFWHRLTSVRPYVITAFGWM